MNAARGEREKFFLCFLFARSFLLVPSEEEWKNSRGVWKKNRSNWRYSRDDANRILFHVTERFTMFSLRKYDVVTLYNFSNSSHVHNLSLLFISLFISLPVFYQSHNSWNDFIRRLKSIQHFIRFLFRLFSVLVLSAVLSGAFFRVLRILTPSFFLFSLFLLRLGVRNADQVAFEILSVVSRRAVCVDVQFRRWARGVHPDVDVLVAD